MLNNIQGIEYYKFRWWYLFILAFIPLPKGGCMKINICNKQNNKYVLGSFNYRDALKIQSIYNDLKIV